MLSCPYCGNPEVIRKKLTDPEGEWEVKYCAICGQSKSLSLEEGGGIKEIFPAVAKREFEEFFDIEKLTESLGYGKKWSTTEIKAYVKEFHVLMNGSCFFLGKMITISQSLMLQLIT